MKSEHSVRSYTVTTVEIGFADGRVCCDLCPLLETYARRQCRRTGEYITDGRIYGMFCPLEWEGKVPNEKL